MILNQVSFVSSWKKTYFVMLKGKKCYFGLQHTKQGKEEWSI